MYPPYFQGYPPFYGMPQYGSPVGMAPTKGKSGRSALKAALREIKDWEEFQEVRQKKFQEAEDKKKNEQKNKPPGIHKTFEAWQVVLILLATSWFTGPLTLMMMINMAHKLSEAVK